MAQQSGHAARQFNKKENKLKAKEKKLIDAIIKDEDTSNKKLGILRRHPYYKASVARAKKEKEVREEREKKGLPPENIFQKSKRRGAEKEVPEREVGYAPKVNALKPADPTPAPAPKKTGSEYKAYPGAAGRAAFEYGRDITEVLDDKTVSQEIKERLEEEELYEGDFKGGRVGKSKKKKVSKAPRGVRAAMRGYKTMKIGGKVGKRTRGTGGSWV